MFFIFLGSYLLVLISGFLDWFFYLIAFYGIIGGIIFFLINSFKGIQEEPVPKGYYAANLLKLVVLLGIVIVVVTSSTYLFETTNLDHTIQKTVGIEDAAVSVSALFLSFALAWLALWLLDDKLRRWIVIRKKNEHRIGYVLMFHVFFMVLMTITWILIHFLIV